MNDKKCEIVIPNSASAEDREEILTHFRDICPNIKIIAPENLDLLGSPLGIQSTDQEILCKRDVLKSFSTKLMFLKKHDAFFLLKNCLAIPKLLYMMRTSPVFQHETNIKELDSEIITALELVCNVNIPEATWHVYPRRGGGLGIPFPSVMAPSAYLASCFKSKHIVGDILGMAAETNCELEMYALDEAETAWDILSNCSTKPKVSEQHLQKVAETGLRSSL